MILDYERALSIFPTFFFLVSFLILSAVYYNRYMSEESDSRATRMYKDYIMIVNSQSAILSVVNGLIIIILYNSLVVGITMMLVTQALSTYVFVALYMKSHYDALFFTFFSILAYVYEFLFFMFSGAQYTLFGRTVTGVAESIFWFVIFVSALSAVVAALSFLSGRSPQHEDFAEP